MGVEEQAVFGRQIASSVWLGPAVSIVLSKSFSWVEGWGESCNEIRHSVLKYVKHFKSFEVVKIENSIDNSLVLGFEFYLQNLASLICTVAVFLIKNYI